MLKESYFANVKNLPKEAYKEYVMRARFNSVLAPSAKLLVEAGIFKKFDGRKNPKMPFDEFRIKYEKEVLANPQAVKRMRYLKELAERVDVYLICMEKSALFCHRSVLKMLIECLDTVLPLNTFNNVAKSQFHEIQNPGQDDLDELKKSEV
jgi:uncharacterized protein YeaO (DUF488 family)